MIDVFDQLLERASQTLDDRTRAEAVAEGELMSDQEAIEYAVSDRD